MNLTEEQKNDETYRIISDIQKLNPHPTEAIILFFNFENTSFEETQDILNYLGDKFPKNTVAILPDKVSLESCSKDVLENIISMITEIIEEL